MQIEDPYSYLSLDKYRTRLSVPKSIINASGDDFFVPDSSKWYFKHLPGHSNYIRYLPNAMHYFKGNFISDSTESSQKINKSLCSYFYFILHKISLPKISWTLNDDRIEITSSVKPSKVKLWVANNETARDFRFLSSHTTGHLFIKKILSYFSSKLCDNCYEESNQFFDCDNNAECKIQIFLPTFTRGWQASFAEIHYNIDDIDFVVTTEVNIVPNTMLKAKDKEEL